VRRSLDSIAHSLHRAGAVLTVAMMSLVCYDVVARQLFNRPFSGTAELAATSLVLIVFLQVPATLLERKLLRVTFLYDIAGNWGRSALNTLAWGAGTLVFGALAATSWWPMVDGLNASEFYGMDSFRVPAWPLRIGTFILWSIAAVVCLYLTVQSARGRMTDAEVQLPD
jgi:TRAP-type C4-dicarboxylate transport system permease small subunit